MGINKICPKFYLLKSCKIKITYLVFVFCILLSGSFWSHFKAVLASFRFWVVLPIRNMGRLDDSWVDCPNSKFHKSHKSGPNAPKLLPLSDLQTCPSLRCFLNFRLHHNRWQSTCFHTFLIDFSFFPSHVTTRLDVT